MPLRYYLGVAEYGDDTWSISFPGVPGVASAGNTFAELMENAPDALMSAFDALAEDGLPIPADFISDPGSSAYDPADYQDSRAVMVAVPVGEPTVQVDLEPELLARLDEAAHRTNSSRASLLRKGAQLVTEVGVGE